MQKKEEQLFMVNSSSGIQTKTDTCKYTTQSWSIVIIFLTLVDNALSYLPVRTVRTLPVP